MEAILLFLWFLEEKMLIPLQEMNFEFLEYTDVIEIQKKICELLQLELSQSARECLENFSRHIMENTVMNDYTDDNGNDVSFEVCNNLAVKKLAEFIAELKE
jgi:hypothetical protein